MAHADGNVPIMLRARLWGQAGACQVSLLLERERKRNSREQKKEGEQGMCGLIFPTSQLWVGVGNRLHPYAVARI
jgi:hypothetical protein